ncbi:MAG TPA: hypothetical protein VFW74_10265 [Acidimicrobiia bacterium]|nr:hypothetical protein [Acidimicrobiia bacterium]
MGVRQEPLLDPRVESLLAIVPSSSAADVASREELLKLSGTPEAAAQREAFTSLLDAVDTEEAEPSKRLTVTDHVVTSQPDGNAINVRVVRPDADEVVPCVVYLHGGGMQMGSCYYGNYRVWPGCWRTGASRSRWSTSATRLRRRRSRRSRRFPRA